MARELEGLQRGTGLSNEDTFAALSQARWHRLEDMWFLVGIGDPPVVQIRCARVEMVVA